MTDFRRLRTVAKIAGESDSPFTEPGLRWMIHRADENGFARCLVRVGRRVLIDLDQFNLWLGERSGENGA